MSWDDSDNDWDEKVKQDPKPQKKQESSDSEEDWEKPQHHIAPNASKWDGEDEEEEEPEPVAVKKKKTRMKPKQLKALKLRKKIEEEKKRNEAKRRAEWERQRKLDAEMDPVTRRLRAQKMAEEADHKIAQDLFGDIDEAIGEKNGARDGQAEEDTKILGMSGGGPPPPVVKPKIQEMKLNNRKDVDRFLDLINKRMSSSAFCRGQKVYFIKNLMPKLCKNLTLNDMNEIKKGINIICNDKAKDPNKKKKKGNKKSVHISSGGHLQDYSMFDDFDSYF